MFGNAAKFLAATAVLALLQACETGPQIRAESDPAVDLSRYQTFGFFDTLSTDKSSYGTILSSHLKDATRRELEQRGYRFDQSNAQLLVNFNVNLENRADVQSTPAAGFYGYRAGLYGPWAGYPQDVETVHYQVGTLSIDVVDAARKQLVWEGVAQGRVDREVVENPGESIDAVVSEIFAKFPAAPGADAAPAT